MKTLATTILMALVLLFQVKAQNAILLHHSTGGAVYDEGEVPSLINEYNLAHQTTFQIDEFAYPNTPYEWENYPYDYWNLWINGSCDSDHPGIECLETIMDRYDVIIFKHCFPGANIEADGTPDINSSEKTIANYKLQYRALLTKFDLYPNKKFVAWTLAPQHRNATNIDQAERAREFVNWVNNDWLSEGGNEHPNVYIFDFFNIVAENNPTPANGQYNCLKYDFEKTHTGDNGHPNLDANIIAGEAFVNFMIQVFSSGAVANSPSIIEKEVNIEYLDKAGSINISLDEQTDFEFTLIGMDGRIYMKNKITGIENNISIRNLPKGIYIAHLNNHSRAIYNLKILKSW